MKEYIKIVANSASEQSLDYLECNAKFCDSSRELMDQIPRRPLLKNRACECFADAMFATDGYNITASLCNILKPKVLTIAPRTPCRNSSLVGIVIVVVTRRRDVIPLIQSPILLFAPRS
jgi:hypothetical protein